MPFIFASKLLIIAGLNLVYYGFTGPSFTFESEWKKNLISLHIIDKDRGIVLFNHNFSEAKVRSEDLFASGISGLVELLEEYTNSDQTIDVIQKEQNIIILEYGEKTISAMISKKNLHNSRFVLREITNRFEDYYNEYYEQWPELHSDFFKTLIPKIMEDLIKL